MPRTGVRVAGTGTLEGSKRFVDLEFTNTGSGFARQVVTLLGAVTTRGIGVTRILSPQVVGLGDLAPGRSRTIRLDLWVPATVREVMLFELVAFANVLGAPAWFAESQPIRP